MKVFLRLIAFFCSLLLIAVGVYSASQELSYGIWRTLSDYSVYFILAGAALFVVSSIGLYQCYKTMAKATTGKEINPEKQKFELSDVLQEYLNVQQIPGDKKRRWFISKDLDLTVWFEENEIYGFQLCYSERDEQKSITWTPKYKYQFDTVDTGDTSPFKHKMASLLVKSDNVKPQEVLELFCKEADEFESSIAQFVKQKLEEIA